METTGCLFCEATNDDWRHSLLDCTTTRCVWALMDEELTEHISINQCGNAKDKFSSLTNNYRMRNLHKW
jgi:hypothetical protein